MGNDLFKNSSEEKKAIALLHSYIEKMRQEISATVSRLSKEVPTGYRIKVLEENLNNKYHQLEASLAEESSELFLHQLKHDFWESCKQMQVEKQKEYNQAKETAFQSTLQSAMFEFYNKATLLLRADPKQALSDLQDYLRLSESEKIEEVSGWCAPGDAMFENFKNQISEVVEETLKPFIVVEQAVVDLSMRLNVIKGYKNFATSVQRHMGQIFIETVRKFSFVCAPYNVSDAGMFKSYLKNQLDDVAQSFAVAAEQLQEHLRREEEQRYLKVRFDIPKPSSPSKIASPKRTRDSQSTDVSLKHAKNSYDASPTPQQPPTPPAASRTPDKKKRRFSDLSTSDLPHSKVKKEPVKVADAPGSTKTDPVAAARLEVRRQEEERIQQYLEAKKRKDRKS